MRAGWKEEPSTGQVWLLLLLLPTAACLGSPGIFGNVVKITYDFHGICGKVAPSSKLLPPMS